MEAATDVLVDLSIPAEEIEPITAQLSECCPASVDFCSPIKSVTPDTNIHESDQSTNHTAEISVCLTGRLVEIEEEDNVFEGSRASGKVGRKGREWNEEVGGYESPPELLDDEELEMISPTFDLPAVKGKRNHSHRSQGSFTSEHFHTSLTIHQMVEIFEQANTVAARIAIAAAELDRRESTSRDEAVAVEEKLSRSLPASPTHSRSLSMSPSHSGWKFATTSTPVKGSMVELNDGGLEYGGNSRGSNASSTAQSGNTKARLQFSSLSSSNDRGLNRTSLVRASSTSKPSVGDKSGVVKLTSSNSKSMDRPMLGGTRRSVGSLSGLKSNAENIPPSNSTTNSTTANGKTNAQTNKTSARVLRSTSISVPSSAETFRKPAVIVRRETLASARRESLAASRRDSMTATQSELITGIKTEPKILSRQSSVAAPKRDSVGATKTDSTSTNRPSSSVTTSRRDSIAASRRESVLSAKPPRPSSASSNNSSTLDRSSANSSVGGVAGKRTRLSVGNQSMSDAGSTLMRRRTLSSAVSACAPPAGNIVPRGAVSASVGAPKTENIVPGSRVTPRLSYSGHVKESVKESQENNGSADGEGSKTSVGCVRAAVTTSGIRQTGLVRPMRPVTSASGDASADTSHITLPRTLPEVRRSIGSVSGLKPRPEENTASTVVRDTRKRKVTGGLKPPGVKM